MGEDTAMPIEVARHAGFCMGVNHAVACAEQAAEEAKSLGIPCYSLGELIHNPAVVASLKAKGLVAVNTPEEAAGGLLVIRSHGVGPDVRKSAEEIAEKTVDCTCAFVHHVQQLVHASSSDGRPVIILGDAKHPEVIGIVGWCQGESYVVEDETQADQLPEICQEALVVSQTTFPPSRWESLTRHLLARFPGLRLKKTICQATGQRQTEAETLAKKADKMIVVGGRQSANTRKLADTCRKWCKDTFLVEDASELPLHLLNPARELIGITAGASTPAWSLKEVVDKMHDMELNEKMNQEPQDQDEPLGIGKREPDGRAVGLLQGKRVAAKYAGLEADGIDPVDLGERQRRDPPARQVGGVDGLPGGKRGRGSPAPPDDLSADNHHVAAARPGGAARAGDDCRAPG